MNPNLRSMTSVFFTREDGLLCLFRIGSRVANNLYVGAAGGHFEKAELDNPEECALRELNEELCLTEADIEGLTLRYVTLRYYKGEIRQNYYFFARLKGERALSSTEGNLHWFSWEELENIPMPVSARHMMDHYLKEGRFTDHLYAGTTEASGTRFTRMESFE